MSCANLKRSWSPTIGLRLTLWGAGITIGVCLLVCVILYVGIKLSLRHEVDAFLEGEVNEFCAILHEYRFDYQAVQQSIRAELGQRARLDLTFRLLDRDGRELVSSDNPTQPPGFWRPPAGWDRSGRHSYFHTVDVPTQASPVRVCTQKLVVPSRQECLVQATYRLDQMTASLLSFRRICLAALAIAAVAALWGGRIIANRSLQPIQGMIAKAQQIGERRLEDRLPDRGTDDELDRLAQTLNEMLERVQRYVHRMQQFTADASHELRSPLAALRGNAEVVLTRPRSADELRQVIEDSVEHYARLSRIADDLLLLARFDAGEAVLRPEPVRLDSAIADLIDLYAPVAADSGLDLVFPARPEVWAECDAERIRQVVGNLVDNAIKYTNAPGRIEITLNGSRDDIQIRVTDTGVGIPPEMLTRVFDRFYRADRARSQRNKSGAGLGLSICRSIAEAHGGRIDLASTPGQGTTVTVTLPRSMATSSG